MNQAVGEDRPRIDRKQDGRHESDALTKELSSGDPQQHARRGAEDGLEATNDPQIVAEDRVDGREQVGIERRLVERAVLRFPSDDRLGPGIVLPAVTNGQGDQGFTAQLEQVKNSDRERGQPDQREPADERTSRDDQNPPGPLGVVVDVDEPQMYLSNHSRLCCITARLDFGFDGPCPIPSKPL